MYTVRLLPSRITCKVKRLRGREFSSLQICIFFLHINDYVKFKTENKCIRI